MADPQTYIYNLRRPRLHNPTYNSNSINNTCFSIYQKGPATERLPPAPSPPQLRQQFKRSRGASQLSTFGSSSLARLEDKDIYNRQKQRYDIISMQPVWHQETIKKYPKYTLEDKDAYYFRRMAPRGQQDSDKQANTARLDGSRYEGVCRDKELGPNAGRQTFKLDRNKVQLDLWESYQGKKPNAPKFQAKMLNHCDEFRSIM